MKKIGIFALAFALIGALSACNRGNSTPGETTGMTMPTVITMPTTEHTNPSNGFQPDQDGFIGDKETTSPTQAPEPRGRAHMRLR